MHREPAGLHRHSDSDRHTRDAVTLIGQLKRRIGLIDYVSVRHPFSAWSAATIRRHEHHAVIDDHFAAENEHHFRGRSCDPAQLPDAPFDLLSRRIAGGADGSQYREVLSADTLEL
jgi:hypothetical protein